MATDFQSIDDVRLQLENQTCAAVQPPSSTALPIVVTSMSMPTSPATRPPIGITTMSSANREFYLQDLFVYRFYFDWSQIQIDIYLSETADRFLQVSICLK